MRAAKSYRPESVDDDLNVSQTTDVITVRHGPMPVALRSLSRPDGLSTLERYYLTVSNSLGIGLDGCALLVPSEKIGVDLATQLCARGLPSRFMKSKSIDLNWPGVKVIPIPSSEGLEFPIVAMAGLHQLRFVNPAMPADQQQVAIDLRRRRVYVGITRAAFALLVFLPSVSDDPVLKGFDPPDWLQAEPDDWRAWALNRKDNN